MERDGIRNLLNMVGKEVKMEGYLMSSLDHRFGDFTKEMETYIKQGKICSKHVIYNGIESGSWMAYDPSSEALIRAARSLFKLIIRCNVFHLWISHPYKHFIQ